MGCSSVISRVMSWGSIDVASSACERECPGAGHRGGGEKPGIAYGETDMWGYKAIRDRLEMHDLHATIMHLLGIDHTKLTFRFSGRDIRLTDVYGRVIEEILS